MKTLLAVTLGLAFILAGCNTVSGFGKDVQKVGSKMEGAAKK